MTRRDTPEATSSTEIAGTIQRLLSSKTVKMPTRGTKRVIYYDASDRATNLNIAQYWEAEGMVTQANGENREVKLMVAKCTDGRTGKTFLYVGSLTADEDGDVFAYLLDPSEGKVASIATNLHDDAKVGVRHNPGEPWTGRINAEVSADDATEDMVKLLGYFQQIASESSEETTSEPRLKRA